MTIGWMVALGVAAWGMYAWVLLAEAVRQGRPSKGVPTPACRRRDTASLHESLAREIERGEIEDRGGPAALRLLARLVRMGNLQHEEAAGHG